MHKKVSDPHLMHKCTSSAFQSAFPSFPLRPHHDVRTSHGLDSKGRPLQQQWAGFCLWEIRKIDPLINIHSLFWSRERNHWKKKLFNFVPCVPGIVAFINKEIKPRILFSSFSLCSIRLSWEFTKKLRLKPICRQVFVFPGVLFYFIRATIPSILCNKYSIFHVSWSIV